MSGLEALAERSVEWAMTYLVHSTVLLGTAWLATRRTVRSDLWRETLWRGALLGSVMTATLASALPYQPLAGRLPVPGATARTELPVDPAAGPGPPERAERAERADPRSTPSADPEAGAVELLEPSAVDGSRVRAVSNRGGAWSLPIAAAWGAISALLLGLILLRNVRLLRALEAREPLVEGPLPGLLAELRRRAGVWRPVRLSVSEACPGPIVIGRSEICVPPRFLTELDVAQQRAALAHELAHVRRRDPLWQLGTGVLNAGLFFQPLNVVARRRLREASEHLCDDWAVRQSGAPVALGRCLAAVASWTAPAPLPSLEGTHAMAEGGSPLLGRIRRISEGVSSGPEPRLPAVLAALSLLAATAVAAPAADRGTLRSAAPDQEAPDPVAAVRVLESAALEDPSPRIRRQAAAHLSDLDHPAAEAALIRLLRSAPDSLVRGEAAQQLDEFPTEAVVRALVAAVFDDAASEVRSNALAVLEDFDLPTARAALGRLAREHPVEDVRLQALAALADQGGR